MAGFLFSSRGAPALTERDTVLLADFVNTTGEPLFDGTLKQALAVKLEESPYLNIYPDEQIRKTLPLMGRARDERVNGQLARDLCQRQGLKAMLEGSITGLGSQYVIAVNAVNCQSGDTIAREQVEASTKEQVLGSLGSAVANLRAKLGESLGSIKKFDAPMEDATTLSLEALKAFSLGQEQRDKGNEREAIPFFKRAIELDPNFALAYGRLGAAYANVAEFDLAAQHFTKAFERRDRVSEPERLYISARYYQDVAGDMAKTVETYKLWAQTYPRDWTPHNNLASIYSRIGETGKVVEEGRVALDLGPQSLLPYANLATGFLLVNRPEEAKGILQQAVERRVDGSSTHQDLLMIAFLERDTPAMQREMEWLKAHSPVASFEVQENMATYSGKLRELREVGRKHADALKTAGFKESAAVALLDLADSEAAFGNPGPALRLAAEALTLSETRDILSFAGSVLGAARSPLEATRAIDRATPGFPATDTLAHAVWLPGARALVELSRGNATRAVELLQSASTYDRWYYGIRYTRASALLAARSDSDAAAEFQKMIDGRGAVISLGPWAVARYYPLAHVGLARAAARLGDTARARKAYQDFFALWKDADADIPILVAAKKEYNDLP